MKQIFLMFFLIFGMNPILAHKNVTIVHSYGNVEIIFHTGYYYEEINKALIIGQYVEAIAEKLNFKKPIVLFFNHNIGLHKERYYQLNNKIPKDFNDGIFLEMKDNEYSILNVLRLIEYSINNIKEIENIEGITLLKELEKKYSTTLREVFENKIYRPKIVDKFNLSNNGISYFYQYDSFFVFRIENGKEKILFAFKNIYQIAEVDEYSLLLFDTQKSFYYITTNRLKNPSLRINIENTIDQILPYSVHNLSNTIVSITFPEFRSTEDERIMLFNYKKDSLIQNVSKLFK